MRFNEFVNRVMARYSLPRSDVRAAVKIVVETMREVLLEGDDLHLPMIGTFCPKYYNKRTWVQPSTGNQLQLPDRVRLSFRSSRRFDRQLDKNLSRSESENHNE